MGQMASQFFPPEAEFTEKQVPDQAGKVFIVTGGNTGVGFELAKLLYSKNATVYIATRDEAKSEARIKDAKAAFSGSKGQLHFLKLDLADLSTIKASAQEFLAKEQRLDVLWLNAGVMDPPVGSKTVQGHELQLGVNCIGHYLFAELLAPTMVKTASLAGVKPGDVRAIWLSSAAMYGAPKNGGIAWDDINNSKRKSNMTYYNQSKAGSVLLASEMGKKYKEITTVSLNPGNLRSELQRHQGAIFKFLTGFLLYEPIQGAYTELYAGLSPDITPEKSGLFVIPWGRPLDLPDNLKKGVLSEEEGGTGSAKKLWDYCEAQTKEFA